MMTSTSLNAFEEDDDHHNDHEKSKTRIVTDTDENGPVRLNSGSHSQVKNGSSTNGYNNNRGRAKTAGVLGRITKDVLFRVFLLLLVLALLIPILVLASLIYANMGKGGDNEKMADTRMVAGLQQQPNKGGTNKVAGEDPVVPTNAKNEKEYQQQLEEIYKKEPWRRDPTNAWKQLGTSLTDSMEPRDDACEDFYAYSCDQWKDRNPIGERDEISMSTLVQENLRAIILQSFDGMKLDDKTWPASVRWAKNFYDRCTSVDESELQTRRQSVVDFMSKIFSNQNEQNRSGRDRRSVDNQNETSHDSKMSTNSSGPGHDMDHKDHENTTAKVELTNETTTPSFTKNPQKNQSHENESNTTPFINDHRQNLGSAERSNATMKNQTSKEVLQNATAQTTRPPKEIEKVIQPSATTGRIDQNIWRIAGNINDVGVATFFDVDSSINPKNADDLKTILRPPTLTLQSRRMYLEPYLANKRFPLMQKSIMDTAKFFKKSSTDQSMLDDDTKTAQNIIAFEKALAKASPTASALWDQENEFDLDRVQNRYPSSKIYSLSNLKSRWQRIDWANFLPLEALKSSNKSKQGENETKNFIVTDPAYIDQLVGLVEDYDQKSIIDYLKWSYIQTIADFTGVKSMDEESLNETCYDVLEYNMPLVMAHVLQKTDYGLTKEEKSQIVYTPESIQFLFNRTTKSLKSLIDFSPQVDNSSKKSIQDELSNRILVTEWPDFVKDAKLLDNVYTVDLTTETNSSFIDLLNTLRAEDFSDDQADAWGNAVPEAFVYTKFITGNTLAMVKCPRLLNSQLTQAAIGQYATIGWHMARELIESVRYSVKTPLKNSKVDQCLINQYNRLCYSPPINSCVDGEWTLEENFADTIALETAFKAYKTWESMSATQGANDAYPAFLMASNLGKFTLDQIFLLAYGNQFCNTAKDETTTELLVTRKTTPDDNRLRGTVADLNDFQLAFHCKSGDRMYLQPKERCQL